jgi:AbrB family looped-hinge helix DNA binding protein
MDGSSASCHTIFLCHIVDSGIEWISDTGIGGGAVATQTIDVKVAGNGRMILPASVRKAMGLHGEGKVILTIEDDQVRLSPIGHGVSRAQALYREHAKQPRTTDEFLTDRKAEAAADFGEVASGDQDRHRQ